MIVISIFGVTVEEMLKLRDVGLLTNFKTNSQKEHLSSEGLLTLGEHNFYLHTTSRQTKQLDLPLTFSKKEAA